MVEKLWLIHTNRGFLELRMTDCTLFCATPLNAEKFLNKDEALKVIASEDARLNAEPVCVKFSYEVIK